MLFFFGRLAISAVANKNCGLDVPCLICEGEGENENSLRFLSVAPEITVPSQLYGVGPATDVTVSCRVQAYPSAINYWVKDQVDHLI